MKKTIHIKSNLSILPDGESTICIFCGEKLVKATRCERKNFKNICKQCFEGPDGIFGLMKVLLNSPNPNTDNLSPEQIHFATNLHNVLNLGIKRIKQERISKGMKPNKFFWFTIVQKEIHIEFLNVFASSFALEYFFIFFGAFWQIPKRKLFFFASWMFHYAVARKLCFDFNGRKLSIPWFRERIQSIEA